MKRDFPILEFDPERQALIEPGHDVEPVENVPEACVLTFFYDVVQSLHARGLLHQLTVFEAEDGPRPVYALQWEDQRVCLMHPGIGAPMAVASLEQVIALGCRRFVACGSAGVLDSAIAMGHLLVPATAVRDEGTSYHYLPAGREVEPAPQAIHAIEQTLGRHHVDYLLTKTWTTDAIFRETPARIALRREEGCLAVEMEAAALMAVAQFRDVPFGQILYGADDVSGEEWDHRDWKGNWTIREKLIWLAAEAALSIRA